MGTKKHSCTLGATAWLVLALWGIPSADASAGDEAAVFRQGDWPFRPPSRPPIPAVRDAAWVANPIDAFVLNELESAGLAPSQPADNLTLLRRVTFDLTGLPPTPAEQDAFLADPQADAYAGVVDRLLASPAYGERWAQHWLDLVRYAETDGFKADDHRPNAYKFRDYVIQTLNADLPYDRFISQQLAGDELEPANPQALIATGLNRLYPDEYNAANLDGRRQEILDDITETTGFALLGLTIACARCHDHKFDDILQADYYRLQAFFAPLVPRDDLLAATAAECEEHQRRQAAWEEATREVRAGMEALLAAKREEARRHALGKFREEIQQAVRLPDAQRSPLERQIAAMALRQAVAKEAEVLGKLSAEEKKSYEELKQQLAGCDGLRPTPLAGIMAVTDVGRDAPPTFRLEGGDLRKAQEEVQPGFPAFLGETRAEIVAPADRADTTGRRSALARWLARPDHPLTSRVIVNRLWQHHFGLGIVPTPNDFGIQGEPASHPQLLDWLAVELVEHGWNLKHLHRLMVTSATYCQSSLVAVDHPPHARGLEQDPANKLLWRARRRRLEGEALRDAMLLVSGELHSRMGGPSARPELPDGLSKSYAWQPDERPEDQHRRSIYVLAKRNLRYPLFDAFDLPDMHHSCARRAATTTAPQALLLLNGKFTLDRARHWAGRLLAASPHDDTRLIGAAYRQAFARQPADDEVAAARAFLAAQAAVILAGAPQGVEPALPGSAPASASPARQAAIVDFCHALLNSNEFLYVD